MSSIQSHDTNIALNGETLRPDSAQLNTGEELASTNTVPRNDVAVVNLDRPSETDVGTYVGSFQLRNCANIATWNVRGLTQGKLHEVERELSEKKIDILGICETHWTGKGHFTTNDGNKMLFSGNEDRRMRGVGLLLNRKTANCLIGYNPICDRILTARFSCKPINLTIIQTYAPTSDADDEQMELFYDALQHAVDNTPQSDILIIAGDFNAKVGKDTNFNYATGPYGLGRKNSRGDRLLEFLEGNELWIGNTGFKQHPRRLYTWTSPDKKTRNQIDYITIRKRWKSSMLSVKTLPGADCGSDHQLLKCKLRIKLSARKKDKKPIRYDVNEINAEFTIKIRNRFKDLLALDDIDNKPNDLLMGTNKRRNPHDSKVHCAQKKRKEEEVMDKT